MQLSRSKTYFILFERILFLNSDMGKNTIDKIYCHVYNFNNSILFSYLIYNLLLLRVHSRKIHSILYIRILSIKNLQIAV